ncbi:MAG: alpha/beta hydrolase [Rubrivivax sp.]|nr:alpha/beta hydrolase [Rubrivivax sp.]
MPVPPLAPALAGERFEVDGVSCHVAGQGPPLLLLHSVNAAASAAEVRPLYEHYRPTRTVFAPDLPGYGYSRRGDRAYTPRLMTDALHAMAQQVRKRCGTAPVDALAVSLGCEFPARAAMEQAALWGRLALVSPAGLMGRNRGEDRRAAPTCCRGTTRRWPTRSGRRRCSTAWPNPPWCATSCAAPGRAGHRRTEGPDCAILTARQSVARFAPRHFLGAGLFSAAIHDVYDAVRSPVWACHGVHGDFTDCRGLAALKPQPPWRVTVLPTGALPYFEVPEAFRAEFDAFLAK